MSVIVASVALQRYCFLPFECNRAIPFVLQRTRVALNYPSDRAAALARDNIDRIGRFRQGCRTDVTPELLLAANFHVLKDYDSELNHANAALQIDRRPELYYDRAMAYLGRGRVVQATKDLIVAARFNPAVTAELSGDLRKQVERAASLK